jgi:uncharacterized RmlC-like cupin family protein
MLKVEDIQPKSAPAFLRDPYSEWAAREGVPVIEDFGVDLLAVEGKPWARFGVNGAIVHLKGRGDFISVFMLEILPGGKTAPQRHLFEQVIYVLSGQGSTTIEVAPGQTSSFEWGPGSLFAIPLNVRYQHFNGSGTEPVRLSVTNNLCIMMKLFGNDQFIFDNGFAFPSGALKQHQFSGEGDYIPGPRGRVMWETNFVPDLHSAELLSDDKRGKSSANQIFILADCKMHAHCSLMPVGTYKKAHRHGADYHVMIVEGEGFSLFWYEGDKDFVRVDWKPGWMFAPPDQVFHQHFNTSPAPARYMATALGNSRYPFTEKNRQGKLGVDVDVKEGGLQIEFEDQDPRIHAMYLDALAKNGVACKMTWVTQTVRA